MSHLVAMSVDLTPDPAIAKLETPRRKLHRAWRAALALAAIILSTAALLGMWWMAGVQLQHDRRCAQVITHVTYDQQGRVVGAESETRC